MFILIQKNQVGEQLNKNLMWKSKNILDSNAKNCYVKEGLNPV